MTFLTCKHMRIKIGILFSTLTFIKKNVFILLHSVSCTRVRKYFSTGDSFSEPLSWVNILSLTALQVVAFVQSNTAWDLIQAFKQTLFGP